MIRQEEVFYIGKISKYRGLRGEVELLFTDDAFDRGDSDYLVLEMDGILVPYFWEEYKFKNDETAILKLEDIETDAQAKQLVGRRVFYPKCFLPEDEESDGEMRSWKAFTGFAVTDTEGRELGTVESVDDSSQNILLYLATPNGNELILPLHEDFVADYSLHDRTLCLALPEGLLEINE